MICNNIPVDIINTGVYIEINNEICNHSLEFYNRYLFNYKVLAWLRMHVLAALSECDINMEVR